MWFFEKMEESRPPLKLKNNGGLLSDIFLQDASFKRYWCQGGLDVMKKNLKNTLELPYNLVFKNMYHTSKLFIF